jgi:hypothetical protein
VNGVTAHICLGDTDHFSLDLERANSTVTVGLEPHGGSNDLVVELLDEQGITRAAGVGHAGERVSVAAEGLGPGRCVARVRAAPPGLLDGTPLGYGLVMSAEPTCVEDAWETDDNPHLAWLLVAPELPREGTLCPGNQDHFLVWHYVDSARVRLTHTPGTHASLALLAGGTVLREEHGESGLLTMTLDGLERDTYVVQVDATDPGIHGMGYAVATEVSACTGDDSHEPNDSWVTATHFVGTVSGVACAGDQDWFVVDAPAAGRMIAYLDTPAATPVTVEGYDDTGTPAWSTSRGNHVLGVTPATANMRLRVQHMGGTPGAYTLTVVTLIDDECNAYDPYEPNDTIEQGQAVSEPLIAQLCPGDEDWYLVDVPSAGLDLEVMSPAGRAELGFYGDLALHGPDGALLAVSAEHENPRFTEFIRWPVSVPGVYGVHVYNSPIQTAPDWGVEPLVEYLGTYHLVARLLPRNPRCRDDDLEDNDTPGAASRLESTDQVRPLRICPNQWDFFSTTIPHDKHLVVSIDYASPPGLPLLGLYLPSSAIVEDFTDSLDVSDTGSGHEELALPGFGDALFWVIAPSGLEVGRDYQMTLTFLALP